MKYLLAALFFGSLNLYASEVKLSCSMSHNLTKVFQREVKIPADSRNLLVGSFEYFNLYISDLSEKRFELQILNSLVPSRSYATGVLSKPFDDVHLSLWTREVLMDASCILSE